MNPLVSILIPAYNAGNWIGETIESALGQTWEKKEVIVVDDGSTDDTLAVARRFESRRVIVVSQDNQGASAARNHAYSISQGDYIQWLDADDLLAPDKIATQLRAASQGGPLNILSSAWGYFYFRRAQAHFHPTALWRDLTPVEWLRTKLHQNLFMQPGVWLVSRQLTDLAGPWDTRITLDDDGEYFARVISRADRVIFVGDSKVFYRRSSHGSLSNSSLSDEKLNSQFLALRLQIEHLLSLDSTQASRYACCNVLQKYLRVFYPERPDLVEKARLLASELGTELAPPRLHWKYRWIQTLFGWSVAKAAELYYNRGKSHIAKTWDKWRFQLGGT